MFEQIGAGEWLRPVRKGYLAACCDCGLVHRVDFRVRDGRAEFRAYRDNRRTAVKRRAKAVRERASGRAEDTLLPTSAGAGRRITRTPSTVRES